VAEVTSLGLVQMTRKRVGQGLVEVFSEPCEHCNGRGVIIHSEPVSKNGSGNGSANGSGGGSGSGGGGNGSSGSGSGGSGGGSGRSRRSKGGSGSSSGGSGGSPAAPAASSAQPPRGPIPAGLVASLARHAEHHEGEHHDGEHHDAASSGVTSAVAEESAVAAQRPASATELDPADGSAPQDSSQAPGEAAVVVLSASEQPAPEQPSAQPTSEQPSEPEPPVSKPRRRRRASAPAGPPTAQHDTDSPTG
jgi:ribonuclease E